MNQNNKQESFEKKRSEREVPNQQRNATEKDPQQDCKTSYPNPLNKDAYKKRDEKDADESPMNPARSQKPGSDQEKRIQ